MKFKCTNKDCDNFDIPKSQHKIRFIFNNDSGKLEHENVECSICNNFMTEIPLEGDYEPFWYRGHTQKMWQKNYKGTVY